MASLTPIAWIAAAFVALAVTAPTANARAQGPGQLGYRDADGNWSWIDAAEVSTFGLKAEDGTHEIDDTFLVTYFDVVDGTGVGFDDPEQGEARREIMDAVLRYVSLVLDVPGRAELIVFPSPTDGNGALAAAGPFFAPRTGFQGGFVFEHLTTGRDPLADAPDGSVAVDFGFPWNASAEPPSEDEFDLYTVLLHEVTHALGFVSIAGPDGRSQLLNENGRGVFSIYDSLLFRGSTQEPLFLEAGGLDADGDDVSSRDVFLDAPRAREVLGDFPEIFAPSPFAEGSSLGHWSITVGFDAVMLPGLPPGIRKVRYTSWELQALADLGYDVVAENIEPMDGGVIDPPDGGVTDAGTDDPPSPPDAGGVVVRDPTFDPSAAPERPAAPPPAANTSGCSVGPQGATSPWAVIASYLVFVACAARASSRRSGSAG